MASSVKELNAHLVALRKESVDRNGVLGWSPVGLTAPSLSARRAWIEIWLFGLLRMFASVALRKESVDRNLYCNYPFKLFKWSLSARRAWIEISKLQRSIDIISVALRKESVDRNPRNCMT